MAAPALLVRLGFAALAAVGVAACDPPAEVDLPISEAGAAAAEPRLAPTAQFERMLAGAAPDVRRRAAGAEALAVRARALRARTAGLDAPVVSDETRARLRAAVGAGE